MIGRPLYFDVETYLSCVEGMIKSDEVERALWMLENLPAYYRDNYPERAKEIKESLHRALFTPAQYSKADVEGKGQFDPNYWPHRLDVLAQVIATLNNQDYVPHIMEIGPGTYWLPNTLKAKGYRFTYEAQGLGPVGYEVSDPQGPIMFVAFELIEHLANEMEIYQAYLKFGKVAKYLFLSTPLYTYGGGLPHWRGQALGHLRTYTPKEFFKKMADMFPSYKWEMHIQDCIVLKGVKE